MTKTIYILLGIFTAILVFQSCDSTYLTKEIPFEDIGFEPAMVLNAKFTSSSKDLQVSVSKNINYAESATAEFELIPDVSLTLNIDGLEIAAEAYSGDDSNIFNYSFDLGDMQIEGKSLIIKGSHPNYPDIIAETSLPPSKQVSNITFETRARKINDFGYIEDEDLMTVTINDDPNYNNFYLLQIARWDEIDTIILSENPPDTLFELIEGLQPVETRTDDITDFDVFPGGVVVTDKTFNGMSKKIELYSFSDFNGENDRRLLLYRNISESEFNFLRSYRLYQESQDFGIFSEPTTLFSNVEGGFGVFSAEESFYYQVIE